MSIDLALDSETCYRALAARDPRFDGVFFVGVTTTGIYCRPICPARTPGQDRCKFFAHPAQAEAAGFRPCLRCRPELAPGHAPVDALGRTARRAAARIEAGALNDDGSLETLARELGLSTRQLRRAVRQEFGVTPIALAQTRRLLLAKQLLTETRLPLIEVALATGFASVRRFNALFRSHYGMPPSRLRRSAREGNGSGTATEGERLTLLLGYRPPLAWDTLLSFLAGRGTAGVESVQEGAYLRTVRLGPHHGWIRVRPAAGKPALVVELAASLTPALPLLLARLRGLFDLDARPDVIASHLSADPRLRWALDRHPGLRVPGCLDGFELAVRAILGQRISVAAATTLAGRLAAAFGESVCTPFPALSLASPTPDRLAAAEPGALSELGVALPRAGAIVALAGAVARGSLDLAPGADPEAAVARLKQLPGVGDWTAQYVVMRALRWPDAFPAGDLGLLKAAGTRSTRELAAAAEGWRPWRSYAAMALWNSPLPSRSPTAEPSIEGCDPCITSTSPARSASSC